SSCSAAYSALSTQHFSLSYRHARQQILQIVVAPPDAAADDEGSIVERVVEAGGDEDRRRARRLLAEDVLGIAAEVRFVVALPAEVERLAGHAQAIVVAPVDAGAAGVVEGAEADAEVAESPAGLRGDEEIAVELHLVRGRGRRRAVRIRDRRLEDLLDAMPARIVGEDDVVKAVAL